MFKLILLAILMTFWGTLYWLKATEGKKINRGRSLPLQLLYGQFWEGKLLFGGGKEFVSLALLFENYYTRTSLGCSCCKRLGKREVAEELSWMIAAL